MSINQLFEQGRRSLIAYQGAINVTSQNVTNAETEGYVRQRAILNADSYGTKGVQTKPAGVIASGLGTSLTDIGRLRDYLLVSASLTANTSLASTEEEHRVLGAIEAIFPFNNDGSLENLIGDFWNAWNDLADNPNEGSARSALRSVSRTMTSAFHSYDDSLTLIREGTQGELAANVSEVNGLVDRLVELNAGITAAVSTGAPNLPLADERDRVLARLSDFVPLTIERMDTGAMQVSIRGMMLVQDTEARHLILDPTSPVTIEYEGTNTAFNPPPDAEGILGAQIRILNQELPGIRSNLDELVDTLVTSVNALHQTGFGLDGVTSRDFFDPAGTSAGNFNLSADIDADLDAIAASNAAGTPGDNSIALAIADLRSSQLYNGNTETAEDFAINLANDIGSKVHAAGIQLEGQLVVADHLKALEEGVSKVSMDEEIANLIQYQQAYSAAARVLATAQEMMDTLLTL